MGDAPPPSYSRTEATAESVAPPAYTPPVSYHIGVHTLSAPLVQIHQLKAHLKLLRALKELRDSVENADTLGLPGMEATPKWAWFISLAVERFERWAAVVRKTDVQAWVLHEMPPIDVLMVWHAYLLNPGWYAEDTIRLPLLQTIKSLEDMLINAVSAVGDITQWAPTPERVLIWTEQTGTPWDPLESAATMQNKQIECPKCRQLTSTPFLTEGGTGYAQHKFATACEHCKFDITREKLCVLKLARDLAKPYTNPTDPEWSRAGYLAGSLHTPTNAADIARAEAMKLIVLRGPYFKPPQPPPFHSWGKEQARREWENAIVQNVNYSMLKMHASVNIVIRNRRLTGKVFSAYSDDRPFSTDLVGAVVRQGSFIDKMYTFGWTDPGYFDQAEDELVLVHSIARYHAFLDLMSSTPSGFFVPTLDIDLAWHTHQLMGKKYAGDCKQYLSRYIDHDDKVEEGHLATSFDVTCRAWQERFGVAYSHCGCPLPGATIGQRLSRLSQNLLHKHPEPATKGLVPPYRADALSATHASEHNAVSAAADGSSRHSRAVAAQRRARAEKVNKRRRRDAEDVRKGRMDVQRFRSAQAHEVAFLTPVPFYYAVAACAVVLNPLASCGAGTGGFAGAGSCAVGAGMCSGGNAACGGGGGGGGGVFSCGGGGGGGGGFSCGGGGGGGGFSCGGGGGGGCGGGGGGGGGCGGG